MRLAACTCTETTETIVRDTCSFVFFLLLGFPLTSPRFLFPNFFAFPFLFPRSSFLSLSLARLRRPLEPPTALVKKANKKNSPKEPNNNKKPFPFGFWVLGLPNLKMLLLSCRLTLPKRALACRLWPLLTLPAFLVRKHESISTRRSNQRKQQSWT